MIKEAQEMKSQIIELSEDLEVNKGFIEKVLQCQFHDLEEVYQLLDDCLDGRDFVTRYINSYIVETETKEVIDRIEKVLSNTPMSVEKLVEYVLNCKSETQLAVTIDIYTIAERDVHVPEQDTCELILYKLIDINEYVNSLKYIYKEVGVSK